MFVRRAQRDAGEASARDEYAGNQMAISHHNGNHREVTNPTLHQESLGLDSDHRSNIEQPRLADVVFQKSSALLQSLQQIPGTATSHHVPL